LVASHRRDDTAKALRGSIDHLYVWEQSAIDWLLVQTERDPEIVLNAWVYDLVRTVRAVREASNAT
jgi:hypothetical protein